MLEKENRQSTRYMGKIEEGKKVAGKTWNLVIGTSLMLYVTIGAKRTDGSTVRV